MPPADSERASSQRPSLIGRTAELARLAEIAETAVEQSAQVILVSGDAGIGKSTLLTEFLAQLGDGGWGRHVGHCLDYADRPIPFGPIVAILRSVLLDNLDRVDDLVAHHRADLSGLLPELGDDASSVSLAGDVDRLFDAISSTLTEASRRRPVAVLVEDIHWADAATRDLMTSLAHSLGSARVLLIATERSGAVDRSHPLHTWLAELRRSSIVHNVALEGLSEDELTQQAIGVLGQSPDSQVITQLHGRTGGNPYFAHEMLLAHRDGIDEIPASLADFLTSRLARLDTDGRDVLRAVAVAGGAVSHQVLASMLPDVAISTVVRSLFDASILSIEGSDYTFGHALLREAILRDVLPFESEELHRRAAEAMASEPRRFSTLSDSVSLALHWEKANDPDRSLAAAATAAEAAADVAAYESAAEMALQALRAWPLTASPEETAGMPQDQLLLQAAEWLANCYRSAEAVQIVSDALSGWANDLPPGRRALILARLAPIEYHLGHPTEAARLLRDAEDLVGDEVSPEAAQVHHRVSKQAVADGQIHPALESAERAISIAETEGPHVVLVEALTTKALAIGVTDDLDIGVALAREARELALAGGFVTQVANTFRTEMLIIVFREGRTDACLEASAAGLAYAEQSCGPRRRAEFRFDLCLGYVEAGCLNDAVPLFEDLFASVLEDLGRLTVLQSAGLHALATGTLELAEVFLADATEIAERYDSAQETGFQSRLLAELARRQGDLDKAITLINHALDLQLASDNLTYTRESIVEKIRIVRAAVSLGRDDAATLFTETTALVNGLDGAGIANLAIRSLMNLELASVHEPVDLDNASETIRLLESSGFRYEAAQTRLLVIDHLAGRQADDAAGARVRLEHEIAELFDVATTHGMSWLADRASSVAKTQRVTLVRVEEPAPPGAGDSPEPYPDGLTPREVEVMSLLAEGLTNKAIGERLYVSPRTVGTHVSNLLAKLLLNTRGEAAAAYHRLGLSEIIDLRDADSVEAAEKAPER